MGSGHVAGGCNLVDLKETRSVPEKVHHTLSSCSSSHRPFSVALLWILSSSVPCGFFPLSDLVLSVLFHDVVESFHLRASVAAFISSLLRLRGAAIFWHSAQRQAMEAAARNPGQGLLQQQLEEAHDRHSGEHGHWE